ncbi:cytochrome c biogenesis protein CcsA [Paenibacillus shunpengii]|uniref:Cytochrome c biogenesis protein CcsA n=1 Tax=Paenibacillus shunpengii TaxID=2054424 RepID=A0ABW5STH6_9BACL|nr:MULTISPECIES: cytochrome c biogenesis protein CcsA [unclassified Paenibacillus]OMC64925.1 ABC transporter permease [Paenibacillus sp. FSL H7-0326]SDX52497.1 HemX protein [Paenibacillus sp. PDC88]
MSTVDTIHTLLIYIYALSLLFYFSDCIRRNTSAKRMGTGLLAVVSLMQLIYLILRTVDLGHIPIYSMYDFVFLFTFSIVITSLIMTTFRKSEYIVFLLNVVGFSALVLSDFWLAPVVNPMLNWQTVHGLLVMHIALANLGFAALTLAAVFAAIYLFLHFRLKSKQWGDTMRRMPSLEMLYLYMNKASSIGTPMLGVSVMLAVLSIMAEKRWPLLLDAKVLSTLIALCIYLGYFISKRYNGQAPHVMARWTLIGYVFVIVSFISNAWSVFHRWTGE